MMKPIIFISYAVNKMGFTKMSEIFFNKKIKTY